MGTSQNALCEPSPWVRGDVIRPECASLCREHASLRRLAAVLQSPASRSPGPSSRLVPHHRLAICLQAHQRCGLCARFIMPISNRARTTPIVRPSIRPIAFFCANTRTHRGAPAIGGLCARSDYGLPFCRLWGIRLRQPSSRSGTSRSCDR